MHTTPIQQRMGVFICSMIAASAAVFYHERRLPPPAAQIH
jgi:hypothetical protein